MADETTDVLLGAIAGAHGVRGDVRVKTFTDDPAAIGDYGPVHTEDGRVFSLKVTKPVKGGMAAKLDGVTDRDQAEALKGTRLYVSREALGEPGVDDDGDEAYFHADLVGCVLVSEQNEEIGRVTAVHDFGAGDLLDVLRSDADGAGKPVLVPFTRAVCPEVDIAVRRIVCVPPVGLLEDADEEAPEDDDA
ncbi:MAG: ribosome maturation factor RimM [Candidatus Phaeomarinobacter sp.]